MNRDTRTRTTRIGRIAGQVWRRAKAKSQEDIRSKCIQAVRDAFLNGAISEDAYEFITGNMRNIE